MAGILRSYCVGHRLPCFSPPVPYEMLCPSPLGVPGEVVIEDHRFGPDIDGAALAEYSQLFALAEMMAAGDVAADDLYLFQYRKFISPNSGGVESTAPWLKVLTPKSADPVFPSLAQLASAKDSRVIVGSFFPLGESISGNYARVHVIEDLVMFAAACANVSDLRPEDIRALATLQGIIPSPALCYIKSDLFVRTMVILRRVWKEFVAHYQIRREGYQRRVPGYLLERLHSVLLCRWLLEGTEPNVHIWQRYVVAATTESEPAAEPAVA